MIDVQKISQLADEFDLSLVLDRYQRDTRLPTTVVREHGREIKRFLSMCALSPGSYGMRGPLDDLWHTFIIHTELYDNFCNKIVGNFIHHYPVVHDEADKRQSPPDESYPVFLSDYEKFFGERAPAHIWPTPLGSGERPSCTDCGAACNHKCIA